MHHYNNLLMLHGENRLAIGAFIVGQKPPLLATLRKAFSMRLANVE
jgi:hypothetical protein